MIVASQTILGWKASRSSVRPGWIECRGQLRDVFVRRTNYYDRGVHVNGGIAIMGYSGLATGYPGCRHHGIFRTYSTYIYLAPLHVPFLRPTYTHTCVRGTLLLSKKRRRKIGKGNRGNKRERERRKMEERKGEKREDVSAGILALCHLWERDTSFSLDALLRFRIVAQPRRPSFTFPFLFSFFLSLLSFVSLSPFPLYLDVSPCLFAFVDKENRCQCERAFVLAVPSPLPARPTRHRKFLFTPLKTVTVFFFLERFHSHAYIIWRFDVGSIVTTIICISCDWIISLGYKYV